MKILSPCSTKACKNIHTTYTTFRRGEVTTTPAEPCFECAEDTARRVAADKFVNQKRKSK